MIDTDLFQALVRGLKRQIEREVVAELRTIRQDLLLLSQQDRIEELEASEWAHLEPVGPGPGGPG